MIFKDIERLIYPQKVIDRVVFDLDGHLRDETSKRPPTVGLVTGKSSMKLGHARKGSGSR